MTSLGRFRPQTTNSAKPGFSGSPKLVTGGSTVMMTGSHCRHTFRYDSGFAAVRRLFRQVQAFANPETP